MSTWGEDYFNVEVQALTEFDEIGPELQFGYVSGYWTGDRPHGDGAPAVEWSWEGGDGA